MSTQHLHTNGAPYGSNAPSKSSSEASLQRVKNLPGYTTPVFKGKQEQRAKVQTIVAAKVRHPITGIRSPDRVALRPGLHPPRASRQRGQLVLLPPRHRRHLFPE